MMYEEIYDKLRKLVNDLSDCNKELIAKETKLRERERYLNKTINDYAFKDTKKFSILICVTLIGISILFFWGFILILFMNFSGIFLILLGFLFTLISFLLVPMVANLMMNVDYRDISDIKGNISMLTNEINMIKNKIVNLETEIADVIKESFECFDDNNINSCVSIKDRELYQQLNDLILKSRKNSEFESENMVIDENDNSHGKSVNNQIAQVVIDNFVEINEDGYVDDKMIGKVRIKRR